MEKDTIDRDIIFVTPVQKYSLPKYPSLSDVCNDPVLLKKLPTRWQRNAKVIAAAGLLSAIMISSCVVSNADSRNFLNVAPIFIHGGGTGSDGCVMVIPPVFLSEQEALAIIKSVAESGGLNFDTRPPEFIATKNEIDDYVIGKGEISLKYYDSKKRVAVTYIPMRSAEMLHKNRGWMSVSSYNARKLADMTAEDLSKQEGDIAVGVFYESGGDKQDEELNLINTFLQNAYDRAVVDERLTKTKELSEKNLREQVRDFIEWLQGQGII
jgi:hypothetical protein